ncbi:hypothetical protein GOBAR_DD11572 [Gossypium barbadense]|nr:hypothetical protein GOBAR_DD11572 [Gossypium barbadense]
MDPNLMQKFQAIKQSKKCKKQQLLDKLLLYTCIAVTCCVFCSTPFWLPYLKNFLFISLPKMGSIMYNPKLLFFVGNLIVVVLIGESKIFAYFSGSGGVYYVDHPSGSLGNDGSVVEVKKEMKMKQYYSEEKVKAICVVEEIREVNKGNNGSEGKYHELVLPTEDLEKRADDFIARVNRQRRLEAAGLLLIN